MAKQAKSIVALANSSKNPKAGPAQDTDGRPVWKIGRIDFGGPWCPTALQKETLLEVIKRLRSFEGTTWVDLERGGSHFISVDKLITEARKRLEELRLDDTDALFSLRLSNLERLWGLRFNNVFSVLWWDPEHKICPSPLKHT